MRTLILIPTEIEAAPLRAAKPDAPIRITGVGMAAVAASAARLIADERPDRLILAGIAGASDRTLDIGEVVAVGTERIAELPAQFAAHYEATYTPKGLRVVAGNTTNGVGISSPETRVENMEGAAFMAVCQALDVPCAEVRAISNYTDEPYEPWHIVEAATRLAETLLKLL